MSPAEAARATAERAYGRTSWNYDPIECAVLYGISQAFEDFANYLETNEDDSD